LILDSSAVVAILLREPSCDRLTDQLEGPAAAAAIGAPTLAETGIVLAARLGVKAMTILARFLQERELIVIPFDQLHWEEAVTAFIRFGKGRHPAGLNFGDCMTYATAQLAAEPLLCVGEDFAKTDLALVALRSR
jgi:ribonuclease VapC